MIVCMKQSINDIEKWYEREDPWDYKTNPEDVKRKKIIIDCLEKYGRFSKALDIGCGEGWITEDLPAIQKYGFDVSENALSRLPSNVIPLREIDGKFDLIIATGVLYQHYEWEKITEMIIKHASSIILTCNIKDWEIMKLPYTQIEYAEFPYREFVEVLRVFQV